MFWLSGWQPLTDSAFKNSFMNPLWKVIARYYVWKYRHGYKSLSVQGRAMKSGSLRWLGHVCECKWMCFRILSEQQGHIHLASVIKLLIISFGSPTIWGSVRISISSTSDNIYGAMCARVWESLSLMLNCFIGFLPSAMARSPLSLLISLCIWCFRMTLFRYIC